MKINKETLEQMTIEIKSALRVAELAGEINPALTFIEGSDGYKLNFWVKVHVWKRANLNAINPNCRQFFAEFEFNEDHLLYPCDTNDASLLTGLNWIAKNFSIEWD